MQLRAGLSLRERDRCAAPAVRDHDPVTRQRQRLEDFLRLPPAAAFADGVRTPHGRASPAPAPTACRSKRLRVIPSCSPPKRLDRLVERGQDRCLGLGQDRFERAYVATQKSPMGDHVDIIVLNSTIAWKFRAD